MTPLRKLLFIPFGLAVVLAALGSAITFVPGAEVEWHLAATVLSIAGLFIPGKACRIAAVFLIFVSLNAASRGYQRGSEHRRVMSARQAAKATPAPDTRLSQPKSANPVPDPNDSEHCVQVVLKLSDGKFGTRKERKAIHALSEVLEKAIDDQHAGEFDGDEFGEGECVLFMYGPNADRLYDAIRAKLIASPLSRGGHVIKRYGSVDDDDAREERINL